MARWKARWAAWVDWCDEKQHPRALAMVRIALAITLVYDFLHIWNLDLVTPLYAVAEAGGLNDALMRDTVPLFYRWAPATLESAQMLHVVMTLAAVSLLLGFFTRTSAVVLLVSWSVFAGLMPYSDRGIDTLCRLVVTVLIFARSGDWLSLDAIVRTGSVWGDGALVPAWPRRFLIGQLVLMYFCAGILKTGVTWWPMGHSAALFYALQDPAVSAFDFSWLRYQPWFFSVQLAASVTMAYQWTYPVVLLLMWWQRHPEQGGRLAAFCNRWRLEFLWIGLGGVFHISLAATMNLGIFPWAMLALYPVWLHPDEWADIGAWVGRRVRRRAPA